MRIFMQYALVTYPREKPGKSAGHMLANYAFSFPVYIHHRAHISFMRIFPFTVEKAPRYFLKFVAKSEGF